MVGNRQVVCRERQVDWSTPHGNPGVTNRAQFETATLESDYNHILERDDPASSVQHQQ